jgi:hypothetical protein
MIDVATRGGTAESLRARPRAAGAAASALRPPGSIALERGFDAATQRRLVRTNRLRTFA